MTAAFAPALPPIETREEHATHLALRVLLLALAARLVLAVLLDPGLDEAYAMAVATHWQLSWFDHPPMTFWWVKAMRVLAEPFFGPAPPPVLLRLPFVLAFTATSWVMFDLGRRLFGAHAGLWTLIALSTAPFFLVSAGGWMVPDGPLELFLTIAARLLVEILFFREEDDRALPLWIALGLALGLAGLSKYHAALFALAAFLFVLATRHRARLAGPGPWAAIVVAVVTVSPVLVWNAENGWVSFLFQSSRGSGGKVNWPGFGRALLGQAAYLAPWTLVAAVAAAGKSLRADRAPSGPAAFLVAVSITPIVLFTAVPLLGGDSLPHWQMPGWLFLLPLVGRMIAEAESAPSGASPRRLPVLARRFALASVVLLSFAALVFTALRVAPLTRDLVDRVKLSRFLQESTTWRGLPEALAARGLLARDAAGRLPVVVSFRWIEAARLGEALAGQAEVTVFDGDPRGFAFLADPKNFVGRDLVLIGRPETVERGLAAVRPLFETIDAPAPLAFGAATPPLFDLDVAVGHGLKAPYPLPYPRPRP